MQPAGVYYCAVLIVSNGLSLPQMSTTAQAVVPAHGSDERDVLSTHPAKRQISICLATVPVANELHRIPIAVTGSWIKNGHRFSITMDDLKSMLTNFRSRGNGKVQGDYEHASEQPRVAQGKPVPASGWVENLELIGSTLYADMDWTDTARKMIESKEYRFVSPAIDWEHKHKKSGESMGATLTSLALTNHPFLEELPALMLSDEGFDTTALLAENDPTGQKVITVSVPKVSKGGTEDGPKQGDGTEYDYPNELSEHLDATGAVKEEFADKSPYGDVKYADPGFQADKKKRYPVDTEAHIRAAWSYCNKDKNAAKYSSGDIDKVKAAIVSAWKSVIDKDGPPAAEKKITASDHTSAGLSETSLNERQEAIQNAIRARYASNPLTAPISSGGMIDCWVNAVYDDYVVCQSGSKLWKFTYTIDEKGNVTLGDPAQVKISYIEASEVTTMASGREENKEAEKTLELTDKEKQELADKTAKEKKDAEEKAAQDAKDKADADDDDKEVMTEALDDGTPATMEDGKKVKLSRFTVRKMKGKDGVGKLSHHAVIAADGKKLCGYITAADMKAHMTKCGDKGEENPDDAKQYASEKAVVEYLRTETGRPKLTLSDVKEGVEFMIANQDTIEADKRTSESRKLMLSECFDERGAFVPKKTRRLLASNKISNLDMCDFEDAVEEVEKVIAAGKFLPNQRRELVKLYLSDNELFTTLAKNQLRVVDYEEHGHGRSGDELTLSAGEQLVAKTKLMLSEKNLGDDKYNDIFKQVCRENPELNKQYREEGRKRVQ